MPGRAARRYPLINLHDEQDSLYVEALAPGIDPASMELTVVSQTLTMTGEKRRVTHGVFTLVAVDEFGKPIPVKRGSA